VVQNGAGHPEEVVRSMELLLELWDELRGKSGPFVLTMRGQSMWPAAPEGSLVAVYPRASRELSPGELVTYRRHRTVVTHRIVSVDAGGSLTTWGDSLLAPDAPVAADDVLGRAVVRQKSRVWQSRRAGRVALRWLAAEAIRTWKLGREAHA
jgi:signal peptidase I